MENQAQVFELRRHWQELAANMPCELRVQRLWMEDDHFSFGGAEGKTSAD